MLTVFYYRELGGGGGGSSAKNLEGRRENYFSSPPLAPGPGLRQSWAPPQHGPRSVLLTLLGTYRQDPVLASVSFSVTLSPTRPPAPLVLEQSPFPFASWAHLPPTLTLYWPGSPVRTLRTSPGIAAAPRRKDGDMAEGDPPYTGPAAHPSDPSSGGSSRMRASQASRRVAV